MLLHTVATQPECYILMSGQQVGVELQRYVSESEAATYHMNPTALSPYMMHCAFCSGAVAPPEQEAALNLWLQGYRACPTIQALTVGLPAVQCVKYAAALKSVCACCRK